MNGFKYIGLSLIVIIVTVWAGINISRQFSALNEAKIKVYEAQKNVDALVLANKKLSQKIEYATSSAYIEQQMRDKFILGTENDYWLKLSEEKQSDLFQINDSQLSESNFRKWFDLFTK